MTLAYPVEDPRSAAPSRALTEVLDRLGLPMTYARDEEIYTQEDEVEFLYKVTSGVVRTIRLNADGRRQVGDFYVAGDLFGLEPGPDHQFTAEALSECRIQAVRRTAVRALAGDRELDQAILEATRRELQRMQDHVLLLGRKSAREKVAGFLMSLTQHQSGDSVQLPMGRQDMADYLGLTIETVSRTLTRLQGDAIVEFPELRCFRVTRWAALEDLAA
jgi:CRP/FNR family transcriptional regulator, nitrogen fixation regulation protein